MDDEYRRPDPDELLAKLKAEEQQLTRGNLKIFLGYAAGVGKTYAMLEAAHQRQNQKMDVVIAYVETHHRAETDALLKGLEQLPPKKIEYRGTQLPEMDMDAALVRHPELVLVDELAHTNAPGSRHPKRYQDVEELLEAGINVYTTLNIQHIESLKDVVQQITGIAMHETVPDRIIEGAEIELVDLPPDELIQRLNEGKVYVSDQVARAITRFFRKGNLTALRELSLRRTAERVDLQMRDYMQTKEIEGPWPARERYLVCVSSHPLSERLVRTGKRLADDSNAEWFVVYVETPERMRPSSSHNERVSKTIRLAEELGAKVVSLTGHSVPEAVIDFARQNNITRIIIGKPIRPRFVELFRTSVADEIIRRSGPIDVNVISDESGPIKSSFFENLRPHRNWLRYLGSVLLVGVVTGLGFPIYNYIHPTNLVMLYLAAVVISAILWGRGPSMLALALSVLAFDFFFVEPNLSFTVADTQFLITFAGLLVVGLVISNLAGTVRDQVEVIQKREQQTSALYGLSKRLTESMDIESVLKTIIEQLNLTFSREAVILLPEKDTLAVRAKTQDLVLDENEIAVAVWAFEHKQPAGRGTDTLPAARVRYQPLVTAHGVVGVLGAKPPATEKFISPEKRQLLESYGSLAALAIERAQLEEQAKQMQLTHVTEELQNALLNSISHDLRTPLSSITGAFSGLMEAETAKKGTVHFDKKNRLELIETGMEESARLNRLVGNLLDMSRLEAGSLNLRMQPEDLQEVIGAALTRLAPLLSTREINMEIEPELPLIPMDASLIEQVFVNLLDNAMKFSKPDSPIEIRAYYTGGEVSISVSNLGEGVPPEDLEKIFDKFYRVRRKEDIGGTGLGLSICKGFVEAHGGRIWAQNNPKGGAILTFTLPLNQGTSKEKTRG